MASPPTVVIHPSGDVLFICGMGEQEKRLQVSSVILKNASQVFRALLSPRFREGRELSGAAEVEIALPEDCPKSMSILCYMLHLRNNKVPYSLDAEDVLQLALLADKYGCMEVAKSMARAWIGPQLSSMDASTLGTLLTAAYYFDDAPLFRDISHRLVWHSTGEISQPCGRPTALTGVLKTLNTQRQNQLAAISSAVEELIAEIATTRRCIMPGYICGYPLYFLDAFIGALIYNGFIPAHPREHQTMTQLAEKLSAFDINRPHLMCHPRSQCSQLYTNSETVEKLRELGEDMGLNVDVPCFSSIREGKGFGVDHCDHDHD